MQATTGINTALIMPITVHAVRWTYSMCPKFIL